MADPTGHQTLIHQAFSRQAASHPTAVALISHGQRITYETLDAAATAYAVELAARGVHSGHVIPIVLRRSPQLVALQLAVLKCGAAYAGLDPRWPVERLSVILAQISPHLAIGFRERYMGEFSWYEPPCENLHCAAAQRKTFEPAVPDGSEPAIVFFTSGTTGVPKGVVSPHQAVTRLFQPGGLCGFGPGHATPQVAPHPWDMYALELWGQLTSGGTSVLVEEDHFLPGTLRNLIRTTGVDTLWLTTSLFNLFVDEDPDCFCGLRWVFTGGEKLSPAHVRRFLQQFPDISLHNGYGPAESCMLTTAHLLRLADCDVVGGIPVGRALHGTTVMVLDPRNEPCPAGHQGEICIAGRGLAVGYLGDPELTAAKFPTVEVDGTSLRIYRTGDAGLFDRHGVLHFRGRQDRQVKISGYRVEMGEIEAAARGLPGVRECVALPVTTEEGQVSRLALFYLGEPGRFDGQGESDPLAVRAELQRLLPDYMIPRLVRALARFPVTATGKLDRAALQELARQPGRRQA